MDFLWDKITEWLKEMLIGGIVSNLSGMFDATNQKVAEISGQVGLSPQAWNGSIFSMIQNLSETVIVPIAGAILAFVMTLELIQLITDKNNLNDMDTWIFFKWAFKSAAAVLIVTNTSSAICNMTACRRWVWATSIAGQAALVKPPLRWSLPRRGQATGQGRALQSFSTCPN